MGSALLAAGCSHPTAESDDAPPKPVSVKFEGRPDPQYVGAWATDDKRSALSLDASGKLKIHTVSASPKGDVPSDFDGTWAVHDKTLAIKYTVPGQGESVIGYTAQLSGKSLTLSQVGGRLKTVYHRK